MAPRWGEQRVAAVLHRRIRSIAGSPPSLPPDSAARSWPGGARPRGLNQEHGPGATRPEAPPEQGPAGRVARAGEGVPAGRAVRSGEGLPGRRVHRQTGGHRRSSCCQWRTPERFCRRHI